MDNSIFKKDYLKVITRAKALSGMSCRMIGELIKKPKEEAGHYRGQSVHDLLKGDNKSIYLTHQIAKVLGVENEIMNVDK